MSDEVNPELEKLRKENEKLRSRLGQASDVADQLKAHERQLEKLAKREKELAAERDRYQAELRTTQLLGAFQSLGMPPEAMKLIDQADLKDVDWSTPESVVKVAEATKEKNAWAFPAGGSEPKAEPESQPQPPARAATPPPSGTGGLPPEGPAELPADAIAVHRDMRELGSRVDDQSLDFARRAVSPERRGPRGHFVIRPEEIREHVAWWQRTHKTDGGDA